MRPGLAHEADRLQAKVISFTDLAGHEKYLRTTVFGMLSSEPNYCLLMVAANNGLVGMSKYGSPRSPVRSSANHAPESISVLPSRSMCPLWLSLPKLTYARLISFRRPSPN